MQNNKLGRHTRKMYITVAIISIVVMLAVALSLYFTLGGRTKGGDVGSSPGTGTGEITSLNKGHNPLCISDKGKSFQSGSTFSSGDHSVIVENGRTIDMGGGIIQENFLNPVYLRARVILVKGDQTSNPNSSIPFKFGKDWTYAADNYLYYRYPIGKGQTTANVSKTMSGAEANGYLISHTDMIGNLTIVLETIQKEAAVPSVTITNGSTQPVNIGGMAGDDAPNSFSATGGVSSSTLCNGLIYHRIDLPQLDGGSHTVKIKNKGMQNLDLKFRINNSEWRCKETATISDSSTSGSTGSTVNIAWDANTGYYHLLGKLEVNKTITLTFIDAVKNNGIKPPATELYLTLQDYVVATDVYSLIDTSNTNNPLKDVGTFNDSTQEFEILDTTGIDLTNLRVYSYNNVSKFVYVKVSTTATYKFSDQWGNLKGENTGVSGITINPKSFSAPLFKEASTGTYKIRIWTAQTVDNNTLSIQKVTGLNGSANHYQPVEGVGTNFTKNDSILDASSMADAAAVKNFITNNWSKLAVRSTDNSDILVRVAVSFSYGTDASGSWVVLNNVPLEFTPSAFYGKGFSFNSEDQSLTYNYNLSKGQCTAPLLDFSDTTALDIMANDIFAKKDSYKLKLNIFVESVYAVGSQLDILKITTVPTTSNDYLTYDSIKEGATSMSQNGQITLASATTGNIGTFVGTLDKYVVYVTNNFTTGIRIAVALQWIDVSTSTYSTVELGQYLTSNWTFDNELGGYNYCCSVPGKCTTLSIFDSAKLTNTETGLAKKLTDAGEITASSTRTLRVVIMAETTHKI